MSTYFITDLFLIPIREIIPIPISKQSYLPTYNMEVSSKKVFCHVQVKSRNNNECACLFSLLNCTRPVSPLHDVERLTQKFPLLQVFHFNYWDRSDWQFDWVTSLAKVDQFTIEQTLNFVAMKLKLNISLAFCNNRETQL